MAGLGPEALQTAGYALQPQQVQGSDTGQLQGLPTDGWQRVWYDIDVCPRTAPLQGARNCAYEWWLTCGHFPGIFQAQQAMQQFMWQLDLMQVARC